MNSPHSSPPVSAETAPYWEGLREHRLVLQHCADCGRVRHYPRPMCDACYSLRSNWKEASGRGTIHSWTVVHHPFLAQFKAELPYIMVTIDLVEGVRMQAPLRGVPADGVRRGTSVRLLFEDKPDGLTLPAFGLKA